MFVLLCARMIGEKQDRDVESVERINGQKSGVPGVRRRRDRYTA